ncbi:hypothetical protein Bcep18194_B1561 [Burkholderia lata]|uniref:Uncharacterized protein n=1 Tax=Burkholderia lata (strain ATCC 17760 / DSM 23089 / LMG 22485 / NCIMB 9086 / R18194 / 383) TaxID=482957 RepID=Q396D6_BURL3|nr:hypothetical protein Bcep18194_B1561 [Burkholderia lata]
MPSPPTEVGRIGRASVVLRATMTGSGSSFSSLAWPNGAGRGRTRRGARPLDRANSDEHPASGQIGSHFIRRQESHQRHGRVLRRMTDTIEAVPAPLDTLFRVQRDQHALAVLAVAAQRRFPPSERQVVDQHAVLIRMRLQPVKLRRVLIFVTAPRRNRLADAQRLRVLADQALQQRERVERIVDRMHAGHEAGAGSRQHDDALRFVAHRRREAQKVQLVERQTVVIGHPVKQRLQGSIGDEIAVIVLTAHQHRHQRQHQRIDRVPQRIDLPTLLRAQCIELLLSCLPVAPFVVGGLIVALLDRPCAKRREFGQPRPKPRLRGRKQDARIGPALDDRATEQRQQRRAIRVQRRQLGRTRVQDGVSAGRVLRLLAQFVDFGQFEEIVHREEIGFVEDGPVQDGKEFGCQRRHGGCRCKEERAISA